MIMFNKSLSSTISINEDPAKLFIPLAVGNRVNLETEHGVVVGLLTAIDGESLSVQIINNGSEKRLKEGQVVIVFREMIHSFSS